LAPVSNMTSLSIFLPFLLVAHVAMAEKCSGTICGSSTSEPITSEIRAIRDTTSCTLPNSLVEAITAGAAANPPNVKNVENILPESKFNELFPNRNAKYTYTNFLRAIGKYPAICREAKHCPKTLANMFGHFQQETAGLFYLEEINKGAYCAQWSDWLVKAYPCVPGKKYFGRGAKQLSWNYNYGAFSKAMYGDEMVLLNNPDLVANTWLNFAATMWFFVTPQPPKPSMLQVVEGTWKPNAVDQAANLSPGLGATTMIINGALECGPSPSNANGARNRAQYYKDFAGKLGVNVGGEKLLCNDMRPFSSGGSAGSLALYWAPESGCSLVKWQTAYSALVEGDYSDCKGVPPPDCGKTTTGSPTKPTSATTATTASTSGPTSATTAGPNPGSCEAFVTKKSGWSGNFGATLALPVSKDLSSFSVVMELTGPLTKFTTWSADVAETSGSSFTAKNKPWFGGIKAGGTLNIAFQASFSGSEPGFKSINLNGEKLC